VGTQDGGAGFVRSAAALSVNVLRPARFPFLCVLTHDIFRALAVTAPHSGRCLQRLTAQACQTPPFAKQNRANLQNSACGFICIVV